MRIGEAAERLGVSPRTIKYYEEVGLLTVGRSSGNYRDYDAEDLERVERIRTLQKFGYSLAAIREFLKYPRQLDESGQRRLSTRDMASALTALEAQLTAVREHVARARVEVEHGERHAAELEADIARLRGRLAQRRGATLATPGAGR
jgi:DNA-binding transcriptional MerR regulator